jgi:pyrimidine operon attenuation protein/uracil phosphoribosyltransferase
MEGPLGHRNTVLITIIVDLGHRNTVLITIIVDLGHRNSPYYNYCGPRT